MLKRIRKHLSNDRAAGGGSFEAAIFMILFVVCLLIIIEVVGAVKCGLDLSHAAETIAKQIQITGTVNKDTKTAFDQTVAANSSIGSPSLTIVINSTGEEITEITQSTSREIQLGESYTVIVKGKAGLGGYLLGSGGSGRIQIPLTGKFVGVSERYFKDA